MDAAPPTYEVATLRNPWILIAPYVSSNDLHSSALVSRSWNSVFSAQLWGNPSSHFAADDDGLHDALSAFLSSLRNARLTTRERTHTLHLPPDDADRISVDGNEWLADTLELLPRLQSLIVRGFSRFDHASLMRVRLRDRDPMSLRLLDVSNCANVTPGALARLLRRCLFLFYLDLSYTPAARQWAVLDTLKHMIGLQVLKLRGLELDNSHIFMHSDAIGRRVRSLDLTENSITDQCLPTLIEKCFPDRVNARSNLYSQQTDASDPSLGADMLAISQGDGFESYIRRSFTTSFVERLCVEDSTDPGITHLYLSRNYLTPVGICELLQTGALHVLDVGGQSLYTDRHFTRRRLASVWQAQSGKTVVAALLCDASERLHHLRVNYALLMAPALPSKVDELVLTHKSTLQAPAAFVSSSAGASDDQSNSSGARAPRLNPGMMPHLRTFVLTEFPALSPDRKIVDRLINFITECAVQVAHARAQAKLDWTSPPGREGQSSTLRHFAEGLFALEKIVLEISPQAPTGAAVTTSSMHETKLSVTEDADSEVLWSAAADDFSFFGGESAASTAERENHNSNPDSSQDENQEPKMPVEAPVDVVDNIAILAAFRQDRRSAHERRLSSDADVDFTDGYWPGVIQIVRSANGINADQTSDYFSWTFRYA